MLPNPKKGHYLTSFCQKCFHSHSERHGCESQLCGEDSVEMCNLQETTIPAVSSAQPQGNKVEGRSIARPMLIGREIYDYGHRQARYT